MQFFYIQKTFFTELKMKFITHFLVYLLIYYQLSKNGKQKILKLISFKTQLLHF